VTATRRLQPVPEDSLLSREARLRKVLRPQFAGVTYEPALDDPVLWGPPCSVKGCYGAFVPSSGPRFCLTHRKRLTRLGLPEDSWPGTGSSAALSPVSEAEARRLMKFDSSGLPELAALEFRYALQARHDERHVRLFPRKYRLAVDWMIEQGLSSVLDLDLSRPGDEIFGRLDRSASGFVRHAHRVVSLLEEPSRVDDVAVWRPRHFPGVKTSVSASNAPIDWDRVTQPWLRSSAQQWIKLRLAHVAWATAHVNYSAVVELSEFLRDVGDPIDAMDGLTRSWLVDFLVWMRRTHGDGETVTKWISGVRLFLNDYRDNEWLPLLPTNAVLRPGEAPPIPSKAPRPLSDKTMALVTDEANLAALPLHVLAVVVIAVRLGLRIGSILRLELDCLDHDSQGRPVLHYWNTKRERFATIPVLHDDVVQVVQRQQAATRKRFEGATNQGTPRWLLPAPYGNVDGERHLSYSTVTTHTVAWFRNLGGTEHITFHRFRHTFATQLLNDGASVGLVQRLLDHSTPAAVATYARLSDTTVRTEWEKVRRVDAEGNPVIFSDDESMAAAEWARDEYARLKVTLPNGYCSLPIQQGCEMRNACLDCTPYFVTTEEFLPVHERQRAETLALIERAESTGAERMAERNRQVLVKLDTLIASLTAPRKDAG
jgi:integrase